MRIAAGSAKEALAFDNEYAVDETASSSQIARKVGNNVAGVVFGAVNERRLASSENRQTDCVHPRRLDYPAVVAKMTLLIDDRNIEPAIVRPEPSRPDNRTDLPTFQIQIEPWRCGRSCRLEAFRRIHVGVALVVAGPLVERVQQTLH